MSSDEQPFIDYWPMFEEACSKLPAPVDIASARIRLARRFNRRPLPKRVEVDLAWRQQRSRKKKLR